MIKLRILLYEINSELTVKNPDTGNDIKLSSALTYDKDSIVYKKAKQAMQQKELQSNNTNVELNNIINANFKPDKHGDIHIKNNDFEVKFDTFGDNYRLNWIKNFSGKYKGTEIFKNMLHNLHDKIGDKPITATGIKGVFKGKPVNGYYTMFRWGFVPDGGIKQINKILNTKYNDLESAINDPAFFDKWKENGEEYEGIFDMSPNSISWKLINNK